METPTSTVAQPPFHSSAKSDVILRSSDNVDFYVLKLLLGLSSPHFESMFNSLPQGRKEKQDFPTVIKLTEESKTLQDFLPYFYPGIPPRVENLDDIINVMAAGHKYGVDSVAKHMSQELLALPIMTEDPLRMFALAFHHGWEVIGRAAAKNTLAISVSDLKFSSELAYISGTQAYQLLQYRLECISAIRDSLQDGQFFTDFNNPDTKLPTLKQEYPKRRPIGHNLCGLSAASEDCIISLLPGDVMIDALRIRDFYRNSSGLKWWVIYICELFREIEARPRGCTVLDERLSDIAIKRAMKCSTCSQHVHQDVANFKRYFAINIEEVVSKVVLHVDFSGPQISQIENNSGSDI